MPKILSSGRAIPPSGFPRDNAEPRLLPRPHQRLIQRIQLRRRQFPRKMAHIDLPAGITVSRRLVVAEKTARLRGVGFERVVAGSAAL